MRTSTQSLRMKLSRHSITITRSENIKYELRHSFLSYRVQLKVFRSSFTSLSPSYVHQDMTIVL